ncbi:hypothetical protein FAZ95_32195 [Trinickia violacea]|uniref:DUF305 domain-containing protein n=2 Tax=Trinickia violacea TaxID=2571746 RepID=A0A4P8J3S2_9BURK|nr:hypothetical protein FAZ95_32195 [Trinickia violacea]
MKTRHFAAPLLALVLLGSSGLSIAADSQTPTGTPQSGMHEQSMMHGGMMGDHMMAGGMMKDCSLMGQLPPGNEKLAMQMHGEMMKAMGDIMLKYADKIQTPPSK